MGKNVFTMNTKIDDFNERKDYYNFIEQMKISNLHFAIVTLMMCSFVNKKQDLFHQLSHYAIKMKFSLKWLNNSFKYSSNLMDEASLRKLFAMKFAEMNSMVVEKKGMRKTEI